ncbi:sugar transferase [Dietzia sp. SL131]|uniref:sugar transferase n=1 Tax=Dietzia sp. SL131 TaxID=2995149 RepID=UPI00227C35D7|nr:sugar transferase [Dietzia sp. SL131]MCY1657973.1 sugar transferase [Dietzia sp. SL131]
MSSQFGTFDSSKRAFDVVLSAAMLVVLAPVIAALCVAVRLKLGRPVFFRQERPGLNGRAFNLIKFRTMLIPNPEKGIESNEQRMTKFGLILRSWSLDELPSIWNVLVGEMSLVGPRPLLPSYLPLYTAEQARRHEVRPGLTGLAQVNGRNDLDWDKRFKLDVEYVDNRSWALDIRIMALTVRKVLRREGVVTAGHVVGAPFTGPKDVT